MTNKKQTQPVAEVKTTAAKTTAPKTETKPRTTTADGKPTAPKVTTPAAAPAAKVVVPMPTVKDILAYCKSANVESNKDVVDQAEALGLISKNMDSKGDGRFFQKSYGEKARKMHLRNYAPGFTVMEFAQVGLDYHQSKNWKPYPNLLSYPLLGMAVLTGREPSMANGVYTNCGKSFGKHQNEELNWVKWFKANEHVRSAQTKAGKMAEEETQRLLAAAAKAKADAEVKATVVAESAKSKKPVKQQEAA